MGAGLKITEIQKAEKRLIEKGCRRKIGDMWDVPIDQLKIDKKYCFRKSRNSKVLKSMAQDIKKKGILNFPTAIYSLKSDEIILATGFGRLECMKMNKKDFVPCRIFISKEVDPEELYSLNVSDNYFREDMKPIELGLLFRTWMKETGISQKEMAEKIHRSETYLSEILSPLKKLSEEEIERILTLELKRSKIMEIAKIEDKELRIQLIDSNASVREIRNIINNQENTKKAEDSDIRIFNISDEVESSVGKVQVNLELKFPNENHTIKDVTFVLNETIRKVEGSLNKHNSNISPEPFNFD